MLRLRRTGWLLVSLAAVVAAACSSDERSEPVATGTPPATATAVATGTPASAPSADAPVPPRPILDLRGVEPAIEGALWGLLDAAPEGFDANLVRLLGRSEDVRTAWFISDMLRFVFTPDVLFALEETFADLAGVERGEYERWTGITNYLIENDVPAPDGYASWKRALHLQYDDAWRPFFDDTDAEVDWRMISWGGVFIDDRPIDPPNIDCFTCIPALNDPGVTPAGGGGWYPDDALVFGVEVNGEARAYPRNQMEVHEMVNDTLGGRRIAVVYCTLCGSAQAFFTDDLPEGIDTPTGTFELRTSGLLSRSNKVMFEFHTQSYFDTFLGRAVSGPLQDAGLVLEPISVSTATWGDWKAGRPDTTIVARDGGIGAEYPEDPLRGRDDDGPIFPIGRPDPRLPVQDLVLGVVHGDVTVAFPEIAARAALLAGQAVEYGDVVVEAEAGALRARSKDGEPITTHQAFWFAWSQFRPDTRVWGVDN